MAYHVGSTTYTASALKGLSTYPNNCTIGIECNHIDMSGKMTSETYQSLLKFCVQLLKRYNLTENDLWLHKEVVGWKDCHRWLPSHLTSFRTYSTARSIKEITSARVAG